MSAYRPIDSKREEFRKYLERAGVMDALTKVLVSLYEEAEKPEDALDYVRKNLGDNPDVAELEMLRAQAEVNAARIQELEADNCSLKERLAVFEPPESKEESEEPQDGPPPEEEPAE